MSIIATIAMACDGGTEGIDAAVGDFDGALEDSAIACDGGSFDSGRQCQSDGDCDRGLFCEPRICDPAAGGADALGCVGGEAPCDDGISCDEEMDTCGPPLVCVEPTPGCAVPGDCDADGHDGVDCGGDDCDDSSAERSPSSVEVCDATDADEDCDPTTVAGPGEGDSDGDGAIAARCCNGETCGTDCNDGDPAIGPGMTDACDAVDEDCDVYVDEDARCPSGLCLDGGCSAGSSRTFGGPADDTVEAVAVRGVDEVFVAGRFQRSISFGMPGSVTVPDQAMYVVKYTLAGRDLVYQWHYVVELPTGSTLTIADMQVAPESRLLVVGTGSGLDLGSGAPDDGGFVLTLRTSTGAYIRDDRFAGATVHAVEPFIAGYVLGGSMQGASVDLGCGPEPAERPTAFLGSFAFDGECSLLHAFATRAGAADRFSEIVDMDFVDGDVWAGGNFAGGPLESGTGLLAVGTGDSNVFAVRLRSSGMIDRATNLLADSPSSVRLAAVAGRDSPLAGAVFGSMIAALEYENMLVGPRDIYANRGGVDLAIAEIRFGEPIELHRAFGSATGDEHASEVIALGDGGYVISGDVGGAITFDRDSYPVTSGRNGLLTESTDRDVLIRALAFGARGETRATAVRALGTNLIVGGTFTETLGLRGETSNGGADG